MVVKVEEGVSEEKAVETPSEQADLKIGAQQCIWGKGISVAETDSSVITAAAREISRALFYPSLLYNVVRSKLQSDYHWYDPVDETILLGALPFNSMLAELIQEGVKGVVTLNQDFELFVTPQTYKVK